MSYFPMYQRVRCGVLMGLTGGAVAQAMTFWGGDMARHLPPHWVMCGAASVGAGLAGLALADAFGRRGWGGAMLSVFGWPIATIMGAVLGAAFVLMKEGRPWASDPALAIVEGAPLGVMSVLDGIVSSPVVATIWHVCGLAMHHGAFAERAVTT